MTAHCSLSSHSFKYRAAQEAGGFEDQEEEQQREGHEVPVGGGRQDQRGEDLHRAQDEAAQHGAPDIADAAHHRGDEGPPADADAHVGVQHRVGQAVHQAAGRGDGRTDGEGERNDPVHRHPHEGHDGPVVRDGPHGHAQQAAAHQQVQGDHQGRGQENDEHLQGGDGETGHFPGGQVDQSGKVPGLRPQQAQGEVFQDQAHPQGGDHRRDPGGRTQGAVGQALDGHP